MDLVIYVGAVCIIAALIILLVTRFPYMPPELVVYARLVIVVVAAIVILRAVLPILSPSGIVP